VFSVQRDGYLTGEPTVNSEPGTVPFAITFSPSGDLVVAEAGTNALATFALHQSGILTQLAVVGTSQSATCWITRIGSVLYASNAGSASVSSAAVTPAGSLALLGQAASDAGPVDSTASPDGSFLYVQTGGAGIVDEYAVGPGGSLAELGSVTVPDAVGGEGIAAS
jgi:6-phosphogluconolactonase (cycloisomerase 2 family)